MYILVIYRSYRLTHPWSKIPKLLLGIIYSRLCSTVILQNRGTTPDHLSTALYILLKHAAGDHFDCPSSEDTWCCWNRPSCTSIPTSVSTYTPTDIQKIREVFNTYASPEFFSHLTLGLTQNANESLHNMIWPRCPKNVCISQINQNQYSPCYPCLQRDRTIFIWNYDRFRSISSKSVDD